MLSSVPPQYREASFMAGQFGEHASNPTVNRLLIHVVVYALLTEIPAIFFLYSSPFWSSVFLLVVFSVSVWNGGGFYIEVFGRK